MFKHLRPGMSVMVNHEGYTPRRHSVESATEDTLVVNGQRYDRATGLERGVSLKYGSRLTPVDSPLPAAQPAPSSAPLPAPAPAQTQRKRLLNPDQA